MKILKTFKKTSEKFKFLREFFSLSTMELSNFLQIHDTTYRRYEKDELSIKNEVEEKVCQFYDDPEINNFLYYHGKIHVEIQVKFIFDKY